MSELLNEIKTNLMTAYKNHAVGLMDSLIESIGTLKITIHDDKNNPHDIVLLDDVLGLIKVFKGALEGDNVEPETLDSDG